MGQMSDTELAAYHQKKRSDRQDRKQSEKQAKRDLDALSTEAIDQAIAAAERVVAGERQVGLEVELKTTDEAVFVRKRVNEALRAGEWLHDVRVWIWQAAEHRQEPLTEAGRTLGIELRVEAA